MRDRQANAIWFLSGVLVALGALQLQGNARAADEPPGIWDRTLATLSDTADRYTSDAAIADYVLASVAKQERVNRILAQRESGYRIKGLTVVLGVAPALHVGIEDLGTSPPRPARGPR